MLRSPEGATVDEVASATGWQRHTVRGVFSGTLKKKLGLTIASAKEERGRVYRINGPAMKPSFHEASARRNSGGPSPVPGRGGDREYQPRSADIAKLEGDIIGLVDRSTQDLRLAWRQVHRTEPPPGLSRDLLIRALLIGCKSKPMAGQAGRSSVACRRWPESSRRAAGPPVPVAC